MARGFTLVELMIVVAVVGVLAAIGFPAVKDMLVAGAVRSSSSEFYGSLLAARSEAIKQRTNAVIAPIGSTWNTGWTVKVGATIFQQRDALRPDVTIQVNVPASGTTSSITYGYNGRVSAGNQTVIFYSTSSTRTDARCVSVDTSGLPRLRTDTNKVPTDGCN